MENRLARPYSYPPGISPLEMITIIDAGGKYGQARASYQAPIAHSMASYLQLNLTQSIFRAPTQLFTLPNSILSKPNENRVFKPKLSFNLISSIRIYSVSLFSTAAGRRERIHCGWATIALERFAKLISTQWENRICCFARQEWQISSEDTW